VVPILQSVELDSLEQFSVVIYTTDAHPDNGKPVCIRALEKLASLSLPAQGDCRIQLHLDQTWLVRNRGERQAKR